MVAVFDLQNEQPGVLGNGSRTSIASPVSTPVPPGVSARPDERSVLLAFRRELDGYYQTVRSFERMDPEDVLLTISGISGRLTGMRADLERAGTQRCLSLRAKEVDPLIASLEFQFRIHSRLHSMREFDLKMTGGAV